MIKEYYTVLANDQRTDDPEEITTLRAVERQTAMDRARKYAIDNKCHTWVEWVQWEVNRSGRDCIDSEPITAFDPNGVEI